MIRLAAQTEVLDSLNGVKMVVTRVTWIRTGTEAEQHNHYLFCLPQIYILIYKM